MAFRKRNDPDSPLATVDWREARNFVLGTLELARSSKRSREVHGVMAIRVWKDDPRGSIYAPCAFRGAHAGPLPSGIPEKRLFEDRECLRVLCHVDDGVEEGAVRRHQVMDGRGESIGTIEHHPPKERHKYPSWRIQQPGHPEIVGSSEGNLIERGLVSLVDFSLDFINGALVGDGRARKPKKPRLIGWKDEAGKLVMISQGKEHTVKAAWLDRRLAFAFALLGDGVQAVGAEPT
ncbi:hypothetical protein [Streptomyces sp. NPDC047046]|uniref:hypothetical protein n=1 Tax=Streptomyces sp. NPDC047046 TaxID=3155378 RepID=UPI0033DA320C